MRRLARAPARPRAARPHVPARRRPGVARLGKEALEPGDVELVRLDQHAVGVAPRLEAVGADGTAQTVDVDLQRADRARGRPLAPERVDEPLARDGRTAPQQQLREQRALLRAAERNRAALGDHLDWTQQPEFRPDPSLDKRTSSGS